MDTFEITLNRHTYAPNYTGGSILAGGGHWETLEDSARKVKVMHRTSIPAGRYQVIPYVFSSKYEIRPLLKDVPNFSGVFIHVGNTDGDTSGCVLVGKSQSFGALVNSRVAYAELCTQLCNAWAEKKDVFLTVTDKDNHPWFDDKL